MSTSSISRAELLQRRLRGLGAARAEDGITPVARDGALPLSSAQRRLWVLEAIQPGGTEYLMPLRLRLRGEVDTVALRAALDQLVARHEILRTRYTTVDGEPAQVIDPPAPIAWQERHATAEEAEALIAADGERPIDIATEHPIRALLVRLAEDDRILLLTTHHIAADGWSESVLLSEVDSLYATTAAGMPPALPPVPVQYADYAAWQNRRQSGEALEKQLAHWRETLRDLTPLALPTDRPRGPVRDPRGATETFTLPAPLVEPVLALGRTHGATPFMVLLAAFQLLLGRYGNQHDVVVGSPVAGRDRAETQSLIGLFANTVVLRTDLSGDPSFTELLARVRETALTAYSYQHTPFERIVDDLAPERDPSRNPIFQVVFQLTSGTPTQLHGLSAEQEPVAWSAAKFDLGLALAAQPDGSLTGQLEYATALFDAATIRRMIGHLTQLLGSIGTTPDAPATTLAYLTAPERELALGTWAGLGRRQAVADTVPEVFEAQVRRDPDAIAVRHRGESLTYGELNARANRLAHALHERGVRPGDLVGVCLERGADLVTALLGVLKAGAGYLPLDPAAPRDRLAYLVEDAAVDVVIGDRGLAVHQPGQPDTNPAPAARPDDLAYVIYTSGSTGRPKGVQVTHANVLRLLRSCEPDFGFGPTDVWTLFHSYAFDFSVWELWGPLLHGGRAVVVPYEVSRSPQDFLDLLVGEGVTVLNQTPSAFRGLVEAVTLADLPADALSLRTVVFGGEALDVGELAPWFARFGDQRPELVNMYGITETTVHVTYRPVRRADLAEARSPVGVPLRDLRLYVLDEHLNPVPAGVPGQLYVSGPGLARGYLGRPGLTADRFLPDPYGLAPGERMYRTGDLARRRADGDLEFLGRADDQVKIRGHRIEPGEIEAALTAHPCVDKSVVLAREERLVAYLTPAPGQDLDLLALREHLGSTLPAYMVPALFVPLETFPLTVNGKVDKKALPDPDGHLDLATERTAPRNPVEQIIAETWAEVLGAPEVGVHDNFFALGGDSIRAIRVVGALRPRGIALTVQNLLVHQTVAGLARFTETSTAPEASAEEQRVDAFALLSPADRAAVPAGVVDAYPMSMVQAAMVYQMLADTDENPYHNITLLPITDDGPFDLAALRAAAARLGQRHEILRTSFDLRAFSEPLQLVHATGAIEVGYTDLREHPEPLAAIQAFTDDTRAHPFDVTRAPMLRFHAHQTAEDRWTFSFIECHAILDGWSHHSLITELMADYRATRDGKPVPAQTTHSVRFADYVARERESLAGGDRTFWQDRLAGFDRVELPEAWGADPAAGEKPYKIGVPTGDLEPGLRRLAATAGVSLKSVLFTAHLKVLATISGSRRFHTGLVCNGRLETEGGEQVRGMHLNTVPLGVHLTGATWTDLVRQVFNEEVAVWPHRRFPLPEMQRAWGGGATLVETAFTYLDFHVLDARHIESSGVVDVSPNEFALDVWTFPGALFLSAQPHRISRANGQRLAAMYRRVLELMAADPAGSADNPGLSQEEVERLLSFADGESVAYPELCLHELFEQQVRRTPAADALRLPDGSTVDYRTLNERANRIARQLRALGVGQETRVGLLLRRGLDLVASMLGVLKAGAAYLPLDPTHPARRLTGLLAETGAPVVIAQPETEHLLTGTAAQVLHLGALAEFPAEDLGVTASPDSLAYIIYTSGSTGAPKGVMIEHRNLVNYVLWCHAAYTPLRGTGSPLYSSVAFDLPVTSVYPALLSGQPVTITEDDGTPNIDALVSALEEGGFGLLKLTPSHLAVLNRALSPEGVRRATGRIIAGGEELVRDMVSAWAEHAPDTVVDNEYGPTETTVGCSWLEGRPGDLAEGVLPIGKPIANTVMRVLDENLALTPVGVIGELYIGGAQVARGYVARPDLTAAKFVPDPYGLPGERLYRTGDLARYREDGVLEFAGRVDHQVKIRGYRIELGEIEAALHRQVPLQDVIVRVHTGPGGDKDLLAYLVPAEGTTLDLAALPSKLAEVLPEYLVPQAFLELDELPLTANGKVDTARLPQPEAARTSTAYVAPRDSVENVLARAWAEALGRGRIGVHDSFTELGGHSLSVMRIIVKLREEHGIRLTFRDFYERRTIAELARVVQAPVDEVSEVDGLDAVVWLRATGSRPPLFCVHPGSAHWFAQLAEHLDPDQPVAAFEWPGLSRTVPAPESVHQIAAVNLAQLRRLQPEGPYRLLGWCGGSQITSEMVRTLRAEGEQVVFMLLDPALDSNDRENMHEFMARFRAAEKLLADLATAAEEDVPGIQAQAVEVLEKIVDDGRIDPPVPGEQFWSSRVRVWRELLQTRMDYRHEAVPGELHLIAGDELAAGEHEVAVGVAFADYTRRWAELAGELRVHRVAGNHLGVLRAPHVALVARVLTRLMETPEDAGKVVD